MKTLYTFISILFLSSGIAFGQYTFTTNIKGQTGIDVDVTITFNQVVVNSSNCNYGFNYQIQYDYDVSYNQYGNGNGNNDLNTLQGYLACGPSNQSFFDLPTDGGVGTSQTANNWTSQTNCSNVSVHDLMCNEIDLVVQGPGIGYQTIRLEAMSTLPVEFIEFNAEETSSNTVNLKWSTASEKNNDYFTVERSKDGKNWSLIKEVKGSGTTSERSDYSMEDQVSASLIYYRLKQVDFDGTTTLLETISFQSSERVTLNAYPNPLQNTVQITGINSSENIKVYNTAGIDQTSSVLINPSNVGFQIDMTDLNRGIYILQTESGQLRIVKN